MHPEFCAADTTFGTNNEDKELFTLAFKDGNNKAFNGGRCFIPNAQKWVFNMMFKYCLPAFWEEEVCNNIRLLITDGCTQEYLPFILNIGFEKTFPKAVHGLCYYHLAIQGFKNNVQGNVPNIGKYAESAEKVVKTIKNWVKTWFFEVEDREEYEHSRVKFDSWVREQENVTVPSVTVEAIFIWIKNSLEPLECLWVNYYRLLKFGLNGRTTSIGEALHWASKGSWDGVRCSMTPATSAMTQMTQAERKGKKLQQLNARNVQSTNLWSESKTKDDLTDWAERYSAEQWESSLKYKCIKVKDDEFWVYCPDNNEYQRGMFVVACHN